MLMRFEDRPVDTGSKPEVVGVDDESAHASSLTGASILRRRWNGTRLVGVVF
jgi:hypothetical protein